MPARTTTRFRPVPGAKVAVPRLPGIFVPRPRLRALFDRAAARPVTVVRAPAGAGKTTALAGWARGGRAVAWVSLDEDDNDETRLWEAILGALRRTAGEGGVLHRLRPPPPGRRRAFLADLDDALACQAAPVRLILDDLQEISRPEPLEALAALARHLPPGLRLVLATRVEPPLRLARLQFEDVLSRVDAAELRFTAKETANLLRAAGAAVGEERVRDLTERTAGWAAALGWTAVSVREAEDADAVVASVTGDDRAVARFFADEVLAHLPAATTELLLCLSICDAVSATLAVRLSGRRDAGARLDELERARGLVTRTPAENYRFFPLLRGFLRAELARRDPERVPRLHGIAARWHAGEGRSGEALRHAVAAHDRDYVLALARDRAVREVLAGDGEPVRAALECLGGATVAANAPLRLASALEHIQGGRLAEAESDLGAEGAGDWWPLAVRHLAAVTGKRLAGAEPPTARHPEFDAWAHLDRAWRSLHRGARRHASAQAQEALRLASGELLDHLVLHSRLTLAVANAVGGKHPAMRRACTGALAVARRHGWRRTPGWPNAGYCSPTTT
ncbi:hypothetical protein [Amycolatopsis sp. WGS_07]|uniref:hypothetical protein n=1 Tax=Amycolatopsis sp. WGS_07 TaxID=3076764 RepID=UPI003872EF94